MHTGWAALGLAAAGRNPRDVERGGHDMVEYIRGHAAALRGDLGERSRTILALRAAGVSPTRAGGRDLLGELLRAQQDDGSFAGRVNTTAFALLALRAAGRSASDRAVRAGAGFIAGQANADGGFNFAGRGGASGADDTGAALQALAAAGRRRSAVVRRAADWLESRQNPDGGFALQSGPSNAQSTAWAVQGLIAAGRKPARVRRGGSRSPLGYLRSLVTRERRDPLLAHERPDAGLGDRAGADRARGEAVPAAPGPARAALARGGARAGRDAAAGGDARGRERAAKKPGRSARAPGTALARQSRLDPATRRCSPSARCSCPPTRCARATSPAMLARTWLQATNVASVRHAVTPTLVTVTPPAGRGRPRRAGGRRSGSRRHRWALPSARRRTRR